MERYTSYDCETCIEAVREGYNYFISISAMFLNRNGRYIVCLFSEDMEINILTLYFLPVLRKEKNIKEMVLLTPYVDLQEIIIEKCRVPYQLHFCSTKEMSCLCDYFLSIYNYIYKRDICRIIINGAGNGKQDRLMDYLGIQDITKRDIVALSLFWFSHVPSDKEVEEAVKFVPSVKDNIDWIENGGIKTDKQIFFPETVDIGLDRILNTGLIDRKHKVIVFSNTKTTGYIIERLTGYEIEAVLDNDTSLSGKSCSGVQIFTPDEFLSGKHRDDIRIIVPTRSYNPICEQLYEKGYYLGKQVFISYCEYEDPKRYGIYEAEKLISDFREGRTIYENIRSIYPDARLYFLTFPGIGDVYLMGMYLADRINYDNSERSVLILISGVCKRVFSILECNASLDGIYVLDSNEKAMSLLMFVKQMGYDKLDVCNLTHSFDLLDPGNLRGYKGLDFNTVFQKIIFHSGIKRSSIGVRKKSADEIFEQNGIRRGKTVLLSPYAKSARQLNESIWKSLVEYLVNKGYDVCTNVSSGEEPIEGTKGLFIPFDQIIDFVEKAGVFIGIRSGLCDLLSHANAKKIILYSGVKYLYSDYTLIFFGLENMGIADNRTREFIVQDEDVIKDIIQEVESE